MKTLRIPCIAVTLIFVVFLTYSCGKDYGSSSKGGKFLVGCYGDQATGLAVGMYTMQNAKPGPSFEMITKYHPWAFSPEYMDYNNGRIAFSVDRPQLLAGESGIAYMDESNLKDVKMVPIPTAPKDYYYAVTSERPAVFSDGRIAYLVVLNTDNPYDDFHVGQLAIYNPKTGKIELSDDPSTFVRSQPEIGGDTEGGSLGGAFTLSPDNKYIYCSIYGYGTDWGVYHIDYYFVARYTVGSPASYERIAQTGSRISNVTSDGKYLILSSGVLERVDLASKTLLKVDDYGNIFNPGQISAKSDQMFKIWRGSGMGLFDMAANAVWKFTIINGETMTVGSYKGLGHGAQYSADESMIYFTASSDYYTNYHTPLVIFSTPVMENNTKPDSITTMPVEYCTGIFLLLGK